MRAGNVLLFVGVSLPVLAWADCTDIISASKTVSSVVQDRAAFESHASEFCDEYKNRTASSRTSNFAASYKFLSASMGLGSASESEVASKVCSADAGQNSRADAYRQYVETISPNAYKAYEACAKWTNLTFDVTALLPTQVMASVSYAAPMAADAQVSFTPTAGITCKWAGADGNTVILKNGSATTLSCDRTNASTKGAITLVNRSQAGQAFTISWPVYDKQGDPVDLLQQLTKQVAEATRKLDDATSMLRSAVVPFESLSCPSGWEEYGPARGRFIRGIDVSGAVDPDGVRAPGTLQEDELKKHHHSYKEWRWQVQSGNGPYNDGLTANAGNKPSVDTSEFGGAETRPKNVALLFCMKKSN